MNLFIRLLMKLFRRGYSYFLFCDCCISKQFPFGLSDTVCSILLHKFALTTVSVKLMDFCYPFVGVIGWCCMFLVLYDFMFDLV